MHDDSQDRITPEWSATQECVLHWRLYVVGSVLAIVLALIVSAGIPKTYSSQVKVSDEHFETDLLLGLNNIAAWAKSAINEHKGLRRPDVYFNLIGSPDFIDEMSHVTVVTKGTDYYHYLLEYHKMSVWERLWRFLAGDDRTEAQRIHSLIAHHIRAEENTQYGTILLQVTDQDAVVAAMLADSVRAHLQSRLSDYVRERYLRDLKTTAEKMEDTRGRFEQARDAYTQYRDSHNDLTSPAAESMEDHLMNEYDNAFSAYSRSCEQYSRAKAFVEKYTLKFALLQNASVPREPSGPATSGYVLAFLFLTFVGITWWCLGLRTYKERKMKR